MEMLLDIRTYPALTMSSSSGNTSGQTKKRRRGLLSCTECHRRKQKCDRALPCNDCKDRGVPLKCKYLPPITPTENRQPDSINALKGTTSRLKRIMTGEEFILTPESVEELKLVSTTNTNTDISADMSMIDPNLLNFGDADSLDTLHISDTNQYQNLHYIRASDRTLPDWRPQGMRWPDSPSPPSRPASPNVASGLTYSLRFPGLNTFDALSALPETQGDPIPKEVLIRYYLERLGPWLSYLDDEIASTPRRIAWLPFAINHKPFFYATLLTAAVHLNRRRRLRDPSALIWFKVQTIKFANEMMDVEGEANTDEMIMVALILLYFNVGGNDLKEYEIHLRGIHQMIQSRGGIQNLGMRGMVKNWLSVCYGPWQDNWMGFGPFYGRFS